MDKPQRQYGKWMRSTTKEYFLYDSIDTEVWKRIMSDGKSVITGGRVKGKLCKVLKETS